MESSLKFEMALAIAREIKENPSEFPDLLMIATGMLTSTYFSSWAHKVEIWDSDQTPENYWPRLKHRLPEILERIKLLDNSGRP